MIHPAIRRGLFALALASCGGNIGSTDSATIETAASSTTTSGDATSGSGGSGGGAAQGGGGSGGTAYVPDPIPDVDPEPPASCGASSGYQFLDDACKVKRYPSNADRDLACPTLDASATIPITGGGTVDYQPPDAPAEFDTTALKGVVPAGLMATVVLVRRVNGVPHFRFLSTGDHDVPYQPWSTSKFVAAANAASKLRISSNYNVGLTASVDGKLLGDFVTSICNYDYSPYSSNSLGRYFHNVGGRDRANGLIHDLWLHRPAAETFGGNYGEASPPVGYDFVDGPSKLTVQPDSSAGPANHLSSYTMAEIVRRLALHRELEATRLPGIQWPDLRVLFYGGEGSAKYGKWGGMSADRAVYIQSGHDMDYIEKRSKGRWRIFSKLGNGSSGEFLDVGYACFPVLDAELAPVPGWGREFIIAAHLPTGGKTWAERDRILAKAYRAIITRIVDGRL